MDRSERLSKDFDIAPEEGVRLASNEPAAMTGEPKQAPAEEPLEDEEIQDEEALEEQEQDQQPDEDDETGQDSQDGSEEWTIRAAQFATESGLSRKELYNNVHFPTDKGEQSLSKILDDYNELVQQTSTHAQERQQMQDMARQAQMGSMMPPPEVMELETQAQLMQRQYDNTDWSQIEPGERADLKLDYQQAIQNLRHQAAEKGREYQAQAEQKRREFATQAHQQTLGEIKEWVDERVYDAETRAMSDMLRSEYHYSDDEIRAIPYSPKAMRLVRDLWQLRARQEQVSKGAKKIRRVSKGLKPGARSKSAKPSLSDVGDKVRAKGLSRRERQRLRLETDFSR